MNRFNFWYKWLLAVCSIMIALGMLIAFSNQTSLFNYIFNEHINSAFWNKEELSVNILRFQSWIYSVLGATLIGWGVFLFFITFYAFKERQKWSWNCILLGICSWYAVDTTISISFEVYFNAILNTILFLSIGTPLIFTSKYFNRRNKWTQN
jgi:hypothetical protein